MNKYAEFFVISRQLPHFSDAQRATIAFEASNGRTSSLSQLSPDEYNAVITEMRLLLKKVNKDTINKWSNANISNCRKLVISAIGSYFRLTGQEESINRILGTACRHASIKTFNAISADELRRIYNTFMGKQRDCHKAIRNAGLHDSSNAN